MKQVTCYYFFINGLFGRNRKVKQDMFYLVKYSETKIDLETLKPMLDNALNKLKPRGEFTVKLVEQDGTIENDNGVNIYTTKIQFNKKPLIHEKRMGV